MKECADSPTGKHELTADLEYDPTGEIINCSFCGMTPAEIAPLTHNKRNKRNKALRSSGKGRNKQI